ncbi:hypothetical protein ABT063_15580 [Streptomyces sp. NPDC002838]|uniref:hypothetical protein n=1 Tax=Streptomyces sp. NPDC002838 TaxID=3154436 RepID=UPI00332D0968
MLVPEPSPTGFHAHYWTQADFLAGKPSRHSPIVGWDDLGNPLTIDNRGRRVRAEDLPDFHSVRESPRIVAALPGNGWRVIWQPVPEALPSVAFVIAWAVYSDGRIRPIANILGEQYMQPLDLSDGDIRLVPPAKDAGGVCLSCGRNCDDPFSPDFVTLAGCGGLSGEETAVEIHGPVSP